MVKKQLFFHVKWQDYPNKKDWTWEPEDHLKYVSSSCTSLDA